MSETIQSRIESALKQARPYLQEDGGDVEFVRFEEGTGIAEVRLLGNCTNCAMSMMTLRGGIERLLLKTVSEIKRVEAVP
jgi:Fe-S cluster biogenesis protein NfuA